MDGSLNTFTPRIGHPRLHRRKLLSPARTPEWIPRSSGPRSNRVAVARIEHPSTIGQAICGNPGHEVMLASGSRHAVHRIGNVEDASGNSPICMALRGRLAADARADLVLRLGMQPELQACRRGARTGASWSSGVAPMPP